VTEECKLFDGLWQVGERHQVWMSHGDKVTRFAEGFRIVATSDGAPFAVIADEERQYYGTQFHPEVVHTPDGAKLIANFVRHVCGCAGDWTMAEFRKTKIDEIRAQGRLGRVICGLSGGVDSAVAAVLIHEAIGEQLTCVFVDHGLMRQGEAEQGRQPVPQLVQHPAGPRGRGGDVPRRPRRAHRPRGQAQVHRRRRSSTCSRRGEEGRRRRLPRPGHALPRRDRERQLHRRARR
jgi:hypothetical protein